MTWPYSPQDAYMHLSPYGGGYQYAPNEAAAPVAVPYYGYPSSVTYAQSVGENSVPARPPFVHQGGWNSTQNMTPVVDTQSYGGANFEPYISYTRHSHLILNESEARAAGRSVGSLATSLYASGSPSPASVLTSAHATKNTPPSNHRKNATARYSAFVPQKAGSSFKESRPVDSKNSGKVSQTLSDRIDSIRTHSQHKKSHAAAVDTNILVPSASAASLNHQTSGNVVEASPPHLSTVPKPLDEEMYIVRVPMGDIASKSCEPQNRSLETATAIVANAPSSQDTASLSTERLSATPADVSTFPSCQSADLPASDHVISGESGVTSEANPTQEVQTSDSLMQVDEDVVEMYDPFEEQTPSNLVAPASTSQPKTGLTLPSEVTPPVSPRYKRTSSETLDSSLSDVEGEDELLRLPHAKRFCDTQLSLISALESPVLSRITIASRASPPLRKSSSLSARRRAEDENETLLSPALGVSDTLLPHESEVVAPSPSVPSITITEDVYDSGAPECAQSIFQTDSTKAESILLTPSNTSLQSTPPVGESNIPTTAPMDAEKEVLPEAEFVVNPGEGSTNAQVTPACADLNSEEVCATVDSVTSQSPEDPAAVNLQSVDSKMECSVLTLLLDDDSSPTPVVEDNSKKGIVAIEEAEPSVGLEESQSHIPSWSLPPFTVSISTDNMNGLFDLPTKSIILILHFEQNPFKSNSTTNLASSSTSTKYKTRRASTRELVTSNVKSDWTVVELKKCIQQMKTDTNFLDSVYAAALAAIQPYINNGRRKRRQFRTLLDETPALLLAEMRPLLGVIHTDLLARFYKANESIDIPFAIPASQDWMDIHHSLDVLLREHNIPSIL